MTTVAQTAGNSVWCFSQVYELDAIIFSLVDVLFHWEAKVGAS